MLERYDSKDGLSDIVPPSNMRRTSEYRLFAREDMPAKQKSTSTRVRRLDTLPTANANCIDLNSLGQNRVSLPQIKTEPTTACFDNRKRSESHASRRNSYRDSSHRASIGRRSRVLHAVQSHRQCDPIHTALGANVVGCIADVSAYSGRGRAHDFAQTRLVGFRKSLTDHFDCDFLRQRRQRNRCVRRARNDTETGIVCAESNKRIQCSTRRLFKQRLSSERQRLLSEWQRPMATADTSITVRYSVATDTAVRAVPDYSCVNDRTQLQQTRVTAGPS